MAKRLLGEQESPGSSPGIPTNSKCDNCALPLAGRFSTTIIDADGGETVIHNTIVTAPAGCVVVSTHLSCKAGRRRIRRERRAAGLPMRIPRMPKDESDLEVYEGGRTYTMQDVQLVTQGGRVLMCMPRFAPPA